MAEAELADRVSTLEAQVAALCSLPDRVGRLEVAVGELRDEMRTGFASLRAELGAEIRAGDEGTRQLMREGDEETRRLMREGDEETRRLMREGDDETRRYMRVLHEEVLDRLKTIGESTGGSPTGPKRRGRAR